jgi:UDP-2,3-diacylglucosamine pyrophosphatase LpxH
MPDLPFAVREESRNIHTVDLIGDSVNSEWTFVLASDLHWDSPHCDRAAWERVVRMAVANNWGIMVFGDALDLMEGRYDPRRSRNGVRPEFDHAEYLDAVIDGFADWHMNLGCQGNLFLLSRGNHEESVRKNLDSDPIARVCAIMNRVGERKVFAGGYGGWVRFRCLLRNSHYGLTLRYHHGAGGAPLMSGGVLMTRRHAAVQPDADVVCMGHVHKRWIMSIARERLEAYRKNVKVVKDTQWHCCTGGFKDDYGDGADGWAVSKDMPPNDIGCIIMKLYLEKSAVATESRNYNQRLRLRPEFTLSR